MKFGSGCFGSFVLTIGLLFRHHKSKLSFFFKKKDMKCNYHQPYLVRPEALACLSQTHHLILLTLTESFQDDKKTHEVFFVSID